MKYFLVLFLTACSNLHYDPVEYNNLINIKETINEISCDTGNVSNKVKHLKSLTDHQYLYVSGRSNRDEVYQSIKLVKGLVDDMYLQYSSQHPTVTYCDNKVKLIDTNINIIIKGIGEL